MHCQKKFSQHRTSFIGTLALKPWVDGAKATCYRFSEKKRHFYTAQGSGTCGVGFGAVKRHGGPTYRLFPKKPLCSKPMHKLLTKQLQMKINLPAGCRMPPLSWPCAVLHCTLLAGQIAVVGFKF